MNIKVQLFKQKHLEKKKVLKSNSLTFSENDEDNNKKNILTDLEYLSHFEDVKTFREISDGLTEASIDFNDLQNNNDHLNYANILSAKFGDKDLNALGYDEITRELIAKAHKKASERKDDMVPIKEMPILKCIKKLSSGSYGTAFVIKKWKEDQKNKFQLEDENRVIKNKYYVLKSCTINYKAKGDYYIYQRLMRIYRNEKNLNYCLFHPNIAEFYGCYYTHVQILHISEYLCFDRFIQIFKESEFFIKKLSKRTIKFIAAQLLLGKSYINYILRKFD